MSELRWGKSVPRIWTWIRWAGTLLFFREVIRTFNFDTIGSFSTETIHPLKLVLSLLGFVATVAPMECLRLAWSAGHGKDWQSFKVWFRWYLESRPWTYALPGSLGAEGLLALRIRHHLGWSLSASGRLLLQTRLMGAAAWALSLAFLLPSSVPDILIGKYPWITQPWIWGGLAGASLLTSIALFRGDQPRSWFERMLAPLAITFLSVFLSMAWAWTASVATGLRVSPTEISTLLALLNFAFLLPISYGGLGLQEVIILHWFAPSGIPATQLIGFSLALHLQRALLAGLGALLTWAPAKFDSQGNPS